MKRNLLDKVEARLGEFLEKPVNGAAPFDPRVLKEKMARRLRETGDAYLPERWYVLLPTSLQARDAETRAWVHTVWEQFLSELGRSVWPAGARPTLEIRYDAGLPDGETMVGIDPASVRPRARAAPARFTRGATALAVAKVTLLLLLLGLVAVAVSQPETLAWRPALPGVQVPGLALGSTRYVTTTALRVRSEPTTHSAQVDTLPAGHMVMVGNGAIVHGEEIDGDDRWADISGIQRWLNGNQRFIWLGNLKPAP